MPSLFTPLVRAVSQLPDPALRGVLLRSLVLAAAGFVALEPAAVWALRQLVLAPGWAGHGWVASVLGWLGGVLGGVTAAWVGLWLFLPLAGLIATVFLERIAAAVERRWYPGLGPPRRIAALAQAWDGVVLTVWLGLLVLLALLAALLLPGIGLLAGWGIGAVALGRGLFVPVALRRMGRAEALALYRRRRGPVLLHGAVLAVASSVPGLNLLVPVVGVAAMAHLAQPGSTMAGRGR